MGVTRGTSFTEPEDAGYESYHCRAVYQDQPEPFFSGQELEPEHYEPTTVPKLSETGVQVYDTLESQADFAYYLSSYDDEEEVPHILATALHIGKSKDKFVFKCLLDSGGTDRLMINRRCIPPSVKLEVCEHIKFQTTQGEFASAHKVRLNDLCLPEFSFSRCFREVDAFVFDAPKCPYNVLLGRKILKQAKIYLDFDKGKTTWLGSAVPFHPRAYFQDKSKLHQIIEHKSVRFDIAESYSAAHHASVQDAIYNMHDPDQVAAEQLHLTKVKRK